MGHGSGPAERITVGPAILVGKPVARGTRLAVELALDLIADGRSFDEILANCPGLTAACVAYARRAFSPGSASFQRRTTRDPPSR